LVRKQFKLCFENKFNLYPFKVRMTIIRAQVLVMWISLSSQLYTQFPLSDIEISEILCSSKIPPTAWSYYTRQDDKGHLESSAEMPWDTLKKWIKEKWFNRVSLQLCLLVIWFWESFTNILDFNFLICRSR
jgi:hypothetical protein